MRRQTSIFIASILFVVAMTQPLPAKESYPTKAIELYVPYTAGGTSDLLARVVAGISQKYLGQPVVVVNKPGGGGTTAAAFIVSSKPDGYRLVSLASTFVALTDKTQKIPFEPSDLVPIANFMEFKVGMLVRADAPWKTLADMLDYGRKNPGALRWSHPSRVSNLFMDALLVFRKANVKAKEIPYPGSQDQIFSLLGGHTDVASISYGVTKEHLKAGKARFLVMYSDHRYSDPAGVPSASEAGFPEAAKFPSYISFYAHKNTPEEIKKVLFDAFKKTFDDPEFKKKVTEDLGEEPRFGGPDFVKQVLKESEEIGVPILKEFGLDIQGK